MLTLGVVCACSAGPEAPQGESQAVSQDDEARRGLERAAAEKQARGGRQPPQLHGQRLPRHDQLQKVIGAS